MTSPPQRFTRIEVTSPAGAVRLNVHCWTAVGGDGRIGAPVLLVHGLASNARLWDGTADRLADLGHPVAAVDLRGHGLSDKPESGYDHETIFVDIDTVVSELRRDSTAAWTRPVIAGQSWGANIALGYVWSRPWSACGVVCVDGGTIELTRRFATWEECAAVLAPPSIRDVLPEDLGTAFRSAHPDWPEQGIQGSLANFHVSAEGFVEPWLTRDRHMQILHALYDDKPSRIYDTMAAPVLFVPAGDPSSNGAGPVTPAEVAEAVSAVPRARVRWFPGADHDIHAQHPVELADVIHGAIDDGFLS